MWKQSWPMLKIGENRTNVFKLLFFAKTLHFVTSNQIFVHRNLSLPFISSIYLFFLLLEMQSKFKKTKVYHAFFNLFE